MYAQFRYLDGHRAGQTLVAPGDFATIGRHPSSDLGFDADQDLEVSIRHAAVFKQGGGFLVRDLGSTNGTFLNGKRVRGDRPLEPGDLLQFGPSGPKVEFSIAASAPAARPAASSPPPDVSQRARGPEIFGPRSRTTDRIEAEVGRRTRPWRWIAAAAVVVAGAVGGAAVWQARRLRHDLEQQRIGLLSQVDELLRRLEQPTRAGGLRSALSRARQEAADLRSTIASKPISAARLDTLAQVLADQSDRNRMVLEAAALDPSTTSRPNDGAVAVVIAELVSGAVNSGTGFAIRSVRDTVWLAAARHLLEDSLGNRAVRIAVIFNRTGQAFRASIAQSTDAADAAILTAVIRGGAPVVRGLSDSVSAGEPIAMLGFPFGLDSLGDWRRTGVTATGSVGTVTQSSTDDLAIDGYGTYGASGSPIFSTSGLVVGILSGRSTSGTNYLMAVKAGVVKELIDR
jgi:hypothetical protein